MSFIFSLIFLASVNALIPSRTPPMEFKRIARSVDLDTSGRNTTTDNLNDYETMMHREFVLYSKLYPDKLSLLLKVGLQNTLKYFQKCTDSTVPQYHDP